MFDPAYLDTLDEGQLNDLYNAVRQCQRRARQLGQWGLASWWSCRASEVCDALGRLYLELRQPSFVRDQLVLDNMPPRVAPEDRPHAA